MKKLLHSLPAFFSALILWLAVQPSWSQSLPVGLREFHQAHLQNMFRAQSDASPFKFQSTQRTTGQSTTDNQLQSFTDSVQLSYGAGGTSVFDLNTVQYVYSTSYQNSPHFEYAGNFTVPQISYQQLKRWTVNPNTLVYGFYQSEQTGYDANMNLLRDTVSFADSLIRPNRISYNSFSPSDKILRRYENRWKAGKSDSLSKRFFLYDAQDRLIKDSTYHYVSGSWKLYARTVYTYSLAAQPIKISHYARFIDSMYTKPLTEVLRYDNSFDASGRLLTVGTRYFDGNTLAPYVIDSFAYAAGVNFHTSWKQYQFDPLNNNWHRVSFMHKTLNASNLPDTVFFDTYDSLKKKWVPYIRYNMTYDANNDPVQKDEYIHDFISFPVSPDLTTRFYYENIPTTTSIGGSLAPVAVLNVFPNPFFGSVSMDISASALCTGEEAMIHIMNQEGRIVLEKKITTGKDIVTVEGLAPGTYLCVVLQRGQPVASGQLISLGR